MDWSDVWVQRNTEDESTENYGTGTSREVSDSQEGNQTVIVSDTEGESEPESERESENCTGEEATSLITSEDARQPTTEIRSQSCSNAGQKFNRVLPGRQGLHRRRKVLAAGDEKNWVASALDEETDVPDEYGSSDASKEAESEEMDSEWAEGQHEEVEEDGGNDYNSEEDGEEDGENDGENDGEDDGEDENEEEEPEEELDMEEQTEEEEEGSAPDDNSKDHQDYRRVAKRRHGENDEYPHKSPIGGKARQGQGGANNTDAERNGTEDEEDWEENKDKENHSEDDQLSQNDKIDSQTENIDHRRDAGTPPSTQKRQKFLSPVATYRRKHAQFQDDVDPSVMAEIKDFYKDFPQLLESYRLLDKIGEGTFSSVYKAVDIRHDKCDNSYWLRNEAFGRREHDLPIVAVKRIYATSSPHRIMNEINILHKLSGHPNIVPLITALRHRDQVVAILPYFKHSEFRTYYWHMRMPEIQEYMRCLLRALEHVHQNKLIHRDVKPTNFLYDSELKTGVLVDFGLAQTEEERRGDSGKGASGKSRSESTSLERKAGDKKIVEKQPGYIVHDPRPHVRANRAGTRGFRAPEVLFKVVHQTCALDIWSAGVILLSFFSGQFPFFRSDDDQEALLEIAHIFGKQAMKNVATIFKRTFDTNIPEITDPIPFKFICMRLFPNRAKDIPEEGYDLLEKLLALNPEHRLTATEALEHPFLTQ